MAAPPAGGVGLLGGDDFSRTQPHSCETNTTMATAAKSATRLSAIAEPLEQLVRNATPTETSDELVTSTPCGILIPVGLASNHLRGVATASKIINRRKTSVAICRIDVDPGEAPEHQSE